MKTQLKALLVVLILAGLMWAGWLRYHNFLTRGRRPTKETLILNKLEKHGVPDFSLKDLSGHMVSLSQFKNKIVILNFWASWCDPCVAEFPSLVKLVDHYKGKIILLAVSADNTEDDIKNFLAAFKASKDPYVRVMWDKDQAIATKFGTDRLPETYILTYNNRLIRKVSGSQEWYTQGPLEFFNELTAEKPPAATHPLPKN